MKRLVITISPVGTPRIEAEGFNGQGCAEASKHIEDALAGGSGEIDKVLKEEWNNNDTTTDLEQHQRNW